MIATNAVPTVRSRITNGMNTIASAARETVPNTVPYMVLMTQMKLSPMTRTVKVAASLAHRTSRV